jgi:hypothetical protein
MSAGKGDTKRPVNPQKYAQNYERIFGKKDAPPEGREWCPEPSAMATINAITALHSWDGGETKIYQSDRHGAWYHLDVDKWSKPKDKPKK